MKQKWRLTLNPYEMYRQLAHVKEKYLVWTGAKQRSFSLGILHSTQI